ncbi:hypothetical protein H0H92_008220 [Tricholoma furcatifolium]|nr:hypothetical protein H0H92_008220 [Tricholoma furcatifolium]
MYSGTSPAPPSSPAPPIAPTGPSIVPISTDATNPSVSERVIKIQWAGSKFARGTSDFGQWSRALEDTMCLNNLNNYIFEPSVLTSGNPLALLP